MNMKINMLPTVKLLPKYVLPNVANIDGIEEIIPAEMIIEDPLPAP